MLLLDSVGLSRLQLPNVVSEKLTVTCSRECVPRSTLYLDIVLCGSVLERRLYYLSMLKYAIGHRSPFPFWEIRIEDLGPLNGRRVSHQAET